LAIVTKGLDIDAPAVSTPDCRTPLAMTRGFVIANAESVWQSSGENCPIAKLHEGT
jgi:hypothetical protein